MKGTALNCTIEIPPKAVGYGCGTVAHFSLADLFFDENAPLVGQFSRRRSQVILAMQNIFGLSKVMLAETTGVNPSPVQAWYDLFPDTFQRHLLSAIPNVSFLVRHTSTSLRSLCSPAFLRSDGFSIPYAELARFHYENQRVAWPRNADE